MYRISLALSVAWEILARGETGSWTAAPELHIWAAKSVHVSLGRTGWEPDGREDHSLPRASRRDPPWLDLVRQPGPPPHRRLGAGAGRARLRVERVREGAHDRERAGARAPGHRGAPGRHPHPQRPRGRRVPPVPGPEARRARRLDAGGRP